MALKTDYKDDIFSGNRKYAQIDNGDGTISFTDQTEYDQVGDSFGATQINEIDGKINGHDTSIASINTSINNLNSELTVGGTKFYFDYQGGRWGWNSSSARGAGTFHPFRQNLTTVYLGGAGSYNISAYQSYNYVLYYTVASISLQFSYGDGTGPRSASGSATGLSAGGIVNSGGTATFYAPQYSFNTDPSSPPHNVYGHGVCNINCYIAYC